MSDHRFDEPTSTLEDGWPRRRLHTILAGRRRLGQTLGALLVAAALLVPGTAALADRETGNGLDGNTYESPTFGYTVEWDADVWQPDIATTEDDVDTLALQSRRSWISFTGVAGGLGSPEVCVDALADALASQEGVDDWEPMKGRRGKPVAGEEDGRAWAAYTLTFDDGNGAAFENASYLECRTVGEATLMIIHLTSQDDYADEAEVVEALLKTIEPAGGADDRDEGDSKVDRLPRGDSDRDREASDERDEDDRADAVTLAAFELPED